MCSAIKKKKSKPADDIDKPLMLEFSNLDVTHSWTTVILIAESMPVDAYPFFESIIIDNPGSSFNIPNRRIEPVHSIEHSTFDITNRSSIQLHNEMQENSLTDDSIQTENSLIEAVVMYTVVNMGTERGKRKLVARDGNRERKEKTHR